jgi:hypothetical protein
MRSRDIIVRIKSEDKDLEKGCQLPTDCLPAVHDRISIHGKPYECVGRELQLEDDTLVIVTVELQPAAPIQSEHRTIEDSFRIH